MADRPVIRFSVLGTVRLTSPNGEVERVVAQPKRLALLAYLAITPGAYHRRDTLLGLLWPEAETDKARAALRNSLYFLRRHLGDEVILTRGDADVGLDPTRFWCDAAAFEEAARNERYEEALGLYGGDLLAGLFVTEAPEFEDWLDQRRRWLRQLAVRAASAATEEHERRGERSEAIAAARKALALAPFDEACASRLFLLLDSSGDRAGALEAHATFSDRLLREFGARPSPETESLVARLRAREQEHDTTAIREVEPAPRIAVDTVNGVPATAPATRDSVAPVGRRARWRPWAMTTAAVVAAVALTSLIAGSRTPTPESRVVVFPLANATGDSTLNYLAEGLTFTTVRRLSQVRGLDLVAGSGAPESLRRNPREAALALGGQGLLAWSLVRSDTGLLVQAEILRAADGESVWSCDCPVQLPDLSPVEDVLVRELTERFAAGPSDTVTRPHRDSPSAESGLLYLKARYYWGKRAEADYWRALRLLEQVIDEDPGNAEAYAWLSNTYGAMAVRSFLPSHEGFRRAEAAASRALALNEDLAAAHSALAGVRFLYYRDWKGGERELRRAIELDPDFAEAHSLLSHLLRARERYPEALVEARLAARLDPLTPYYEHHIGIIQLCSGDPSAAIQSLRRSLEWDPSSPAARRMIVAAWVRGGQPDSALAAWHDYAVLAGDSAAANLVNRHRADGYEATERASGREELEGLRARVRSGREFVGPMRLARAHGSAGNREAALESLQRAVAERDPMVLYMRCEPTLDGVRGDPRFEAIADAVGLP